MDEINIIRCPSCGGLHLKGVYDAPDNESPALKVFSSGLWEAIVALLNTKKSAGAYWLCEDCGCTFPMEFWEALK